MRDPSEPSANVLSQPSRSRSSGSGPSGCPLRIPSRSAASSCSGADARRARGAPARRPPRAPGTPRSAPLRPCCSDRPPGSWTATTPSASEVVDERPHAPPASASTVGRGIRPATSRAATSCRTPVGRAVLVAPDHAARRDRASTRPPRPSASAAWLATQRVVVVRPQRDPPARARRARGRRRSASGRGASGSQPAPSIQRVAAPAAAPRPPRGPARRAPRSTSAVLELDPRPRERRLDEVQVRVGQPGDRRPRPARASMTPRARARPRRRRRRRVARGDDPPAAIADRLDPARAVVTGEGRDPAPDDEGRARHGGIRASGGVDDGSSSSASAARRGRDRRVGRHRRRVGRAVAGSSARRRRRLAGARSAVPDLEVGLQRDRDRVQAGGLLRARRRLLASPPAAAGRGGRSRGCPRRGSRRATRNSTVALPTKSATGPTMMIGRKLATETSMLRMPNTRPRTSSGMSSWSCVCDGIATNA